eukprot:234313_1
MTMPRRMFRWKLINLRKLKRVFFFSFFTEALPIPDGPSEIATIFFSNNLNRLLVSSKARGGQTIVVQLTPDHTAVMASTKLPAMSEFSESSYFTRFLDLSGAHSYSPAVIAQSDQDELVVLQLSTTSDGTDTPLLQYFWSGDAANPMIALVNSELLQRKALAVGGVIERTPIGIGSGANGTGPAKASGRCQFASVTALHSDGRLVHFEAPEILLST